MERKYIRLKERSRLFNVPVSDLCRFLIRRLEEILVGRFMRMEGEVILNYSGLVQENCGSIVDVTLGL